MSGPLQLVGAAAAVVLIVWIGFLPLRSEVGNLRGRLEQARLEGEELRRKYDVARSEMERLQVEVTRLAAVDSTVTVLTDGSLQIKLDNQGNVEGIKSLAPAAQSAVKNALLSGRVQPPGMIEDLAGHAGVLMSGSKEGVAFALTSPLGTLVSTTRPTFRWRRFSGASGYRVTLFDPDFNLITTSPVVQTPSWTGVSDLEPGRTYLWQVTAMKDGAEVKSPVPPAPEAIFKVLEKAKRDELLDLTRHNPGSHLLAGILYAQAGLLDDAERELQSFGRSNPGSAIAIRLLTQVQAWRKETPRR